MSYQVLYRAWRPNSFSEVVGQDAVVQTLKRQVVTSRIAHAYLFCGTRGTGKTTASKILSRAINCLRPNDGDPCGECECCRAILSENCMDVQEIDAASNNGVDEIRELRDKIAFPPSMTRYKVYIVDEVHMLSSGAFNALLKTLEEPPEHAVFILATTEPQKLPATILSRCQRFDFHRIDVPTIKGRLRAVLQGIGRDADEDALTEIAFAAEGGMRDALSLLDCCLSYTDGSVSLALARDVLGTTGKAFLFEFCDALIDYDAAAALNGIDRMMAGGADPIVFSRDVTAHLRALLLSKSVGDVSTLIEATPEDAAHIAEQAKRADMAHLMRLTDLFMRVESESKWFSRPRTMLELHTVRACHPEQEDEATLSERLDRMEKQLANGTFAAKPAAKPAAPAPKPAAPKAEKPAAATPAPRNAEPTPAFLAACEAFKAAEPANTMILKGILYVGETDVAVQVMYPRDLFMLKSLFERKITSFNAALTEAYERPMRAELVTEAQAKPAGGLNPAAKRAMDLAQNLFPRDKIELV